MADRLNDSMVKNLPAPAAGNRITYDAEVKGFGCRVTAAGARSFVLTYRARAGRQGRVTIGSFPDWTVKQARERAKELKRDIDDGADPIRERQAEREAPTIADLAARYQVEHAVRKRPRSAAEDKAMLHRLILPKLGRLRVAAVRRSEIEALHREISRRAPIYANRCLALLSKMLALAVAWEWRPDNPCRGIEKNPEHKRARYLTPSELERLLAAVAVHSHQSSANAIRLLLLTGARRSEVLGADWTQIDFEVGAWTKPGSTTKQKKMHRTPLSASALQLLAEMKAAADRRARAKLPPERFLFPGKDGKPQTDIKRFWASICATAGIAGLRLHDLRHSYASMLVSSGLSLPIIGSLLGHSNPATTQRYAHLADAALRAATERVGAIVTDAAATASAGGEVIPIGGRHG